MQRHTKIVFISAAAATVIAVSAGVGIAVTGGDDQPLTAQIRERAVAAALAHTGGGEVTETELGDGSAAYEVEVVLPDGSQVEVQLDERFSVIGSEADDDGPGEAEDDDGPGEADDD